MNHSDCGNGQSGFVNVSVHVCTQYHASSSVANRQKCHRSFLPWPSSTLQLPRNWGTHYTLVHRTMTIRVDNVCAKVCAGSKNGHGIGCLCAFRWVSALRKVQYTTRLPIRHGPSIAFTSNLPYCQMGNVVNSMLPCRIYGFSRWTVYPIY